MKDKVLVRAPFAYDSDEASVQSGLQCLDESRTLQSHAEDADINVLMRRFGVTGMLPVGAVEPSYMDYTEVVDFRTAQEAVLRARDNFMKLDASIRARFGNDPQQFLEFASNENNVREMVQMGLAIVKPGYNSDGTKIVEESVKKE